MFFNNWLFGLYVRLKFWLSFRRQTWTLADYPIRCLRMPADAVPPRPDLKPVPWSAQVHGWFGILGVGDTRQQALDEMRRCFDRYLESGKPLPRPGAIAPPPFTLADIQAEKIYQYVHLWDEFTDHICDVEQVFFLTDTSSLDNFIFTDKTRAEQNRLVALRYGVDIADIEDGNLLRIFHRIEAHASRASGRRGPGGLPG